ncbi:restriction endonuclease subunit S, partial [Xylella fastidiosa]
YYHFLFRTKKYLQQFKIRSRGIMDMRLRLYFDQFGQIPIPVPPRPEQDQIVAYLRAQDVHIARFIKAKRELIKLLTEQKRRIIDHAVTRGLDVSVALKPSGIEWLGDVPVHCRIERLKWVCRFTYGDSLSDANRRQGNVPVYGSNGPVGMHDVANVVGPCIVIGRKGSFGKVNYSESDLFAIDTTYFVDKKCTKANIRWLYYVLIWCRLDRISKDSAVPGLDRTDALNTLVPVPDGAEQEQIAKQLDIETAEVNDAITKVEEEITLIREYRDRLITDVVTGQVDVRGWQPDVEDVVEDAVLAALGDDQEEMTEQEDDDDED